MTADQLAEQVAALKKAQGYQLAAWAKVQECARQYAQMKAYGSYIENGNNVNVSHGDRKMYEDMFQGNLLRAVERAFLEDALAGQAVLALRSGE